MSLSLKMVDPKVNIQRGIIKNAEKVDTAVMVTDRSKFPPNITVQMLEAPPPGEQPEKQNNFLEKTARLKFNTYISTVWSRLVWSNKIFF